MMKLNIFISLRDSLCTLYNPDEVLLELESGRQTDLIKSEVESTPTFITRLESKMSTTTLKEHVDRFCKDTTNLHSQVGKLKDQVDALKNKLKGKTAKAPKVEKAKFPKVLKSVHENKVNELKKKIEDLKAAHKTMKAPRAPRAPKAPKPIAEPMMPSASVPIAAPSLAPMAPGTKGGRTRRRVMRW